MPNGKMKWYNKTKGFGFIIGEDGQDIFIHKSDIQIGSDLEEGDKVKYEVGQAPKGKKAVNVVKL